MSRGLPAPRKEGQPWAPLQVWYKGKARRVVDGLGLCSPRVRPAGHRTVPLQERGEALGKAFWEEVSGFVDTMTKKERLGLMAELAVGRHSESPFKEKVVTIRNKLDEVVMSLGVDPRRKSTDRETEIAFRVKAWAELVEDADTRYLEDMASTGVYRHQRRDPAGPGGLREEGQEDDGRPGASGLGGGP